MITKLLRPMMYYQADEPNAGGAGADAGTVDKPTEKPNTDEPKAFTQGDVDRIVTERLARESKNIKKEVEAAMKVERDKEALTEAEKLKLERDEATSNLTKAQEAANNRVIQSEAKVQALALGVKPERLAYALKLADLSGVAVDDDGNPDEKQIKTAIEAVLKDLPELKGSDSTSKGGGDFGGNSAEVLTEEKILAMTPAEFAKNESKIQAFYKAKRGK